MAASQLTRQHVQQLWQFLQQVTVCDAPVGGGEAGKLLQEVSLG